jgi:hypothetical protein
MNNRWKVWNPAGTDNVSALTVLIPDPSPPPTSHDWYMVTPPPVVGNGGLLKLSSEQGFISIQNRCCMDLWLTWSVLTHHHQHQLSSSVNTWERVSWLLFRLSPHLFLVKSPGCLELFSNSHFSIQVSFDFNESAFAHADQPTTWPTREPSNMSGLEPDGPLS